MGRYTSARLTGFIDSYNGKRYQASYSLSFRNPAPDAFIFTYCIYGLKEDTASRAQWARISIPRAPKGLAIYAFLLELRRPPTWRANITIPNVLQAIFASHIIPSSCVPRTPCFVFVPFPNARYIKGWGSWQQTSDSRNPRARYHGSIESPARRTCTWTDETQARSRCVASHPLRFSALACPFPLCLSTHILRGPFDGRLRR